MRDATTQRRMKGESQVKFAYITRRRARTVADLQCLNKSLFLRESGSKIRVVIGSFLLPKGCEA